MHCTRLEEMVAALGVSRGLGRLATPIATPYCLTLPHLFLPAPQRYDELRKKHLRENPGGFIERETYY